MDPYRTYEEIFALQGLENNLLALDVHHLPWGNDPLLDADSPGNKRRRQFAAVSFWFLGAMHFYSLLTDDAAPKRSRRANEHRDRASVLNSVHQFSDDMFKRQYRLNRLDFNMVLQRISPRIARNEEMARRSSGSPVTPELKLLIALRILAGASYLDMVWYNVSVDSVMTIVYEVCEAILAEFQDTVQLPRNEEECMRLSADWSEEQIKHFRSEVLPGVIMAGDGFLIQIAEPHRDARIFYNRKGFHAIVVQAFCDAHCKFKVFDARWPGSVSDLTAYQQTPLFSGMRDGNFPPWALLLMDSIYSSLGGNHITPYNRSGFKRLKRTDVTEYNKRVTFNHIVASQRVTIERAFGQLVRRFGILWRRLDIAMDKVTLVACTCAVLHNICVDRWIAEGKRGTGPVIECADDFPTHEEIIEKLRLHFDSYDEIHCEKRTTLKESIAARMTMEDENYIFH